MDTAQYGAAQRDPSCLDRHQKLESADSTTLLACSLLGSFSLLFLKEGKVESVYPAVACGHSLPFICLSTLFVSGCESTVQCRYWKKNCLLHLSSKTIDTFPKIFTEVLRARVLSFVTPAD